MTYSIEDLLHRFDDAVAALERIAKALEALTSLSDIAKAEGIDSDGTFTEDDQGNWHRVK